MRTWNGRKTNTLKKFLPVVFHNLKSYDAHFVIKHFKKQYTARCKDQDDDDDDDEGESYGDIRVTPLNGEKSLSFQVRNLRFIDSFQFLSTSLDNLVSLLVKSGRDKFTHTTKFLGNDDLVFAKGVYPYSYMSGPEKFTETQLPPIEAFYNTLEDEPAQCRITIGRAKFGVIIRLKQCGIITITICSLTSYCWPTCLRILETQFMSSIVSTPSIS